MRYAGPLLASVLVASTSLSAERGAMNYEWTVGSPVSPGDPSHEALEQWAEDVEEAAGGQLKVEIVPLASLGLVPADSLRVIRQKILSGIYLYPYYVARDAPVMGLFLPQGALIDLEHHDEIADLQLKFARRIVSSWDVEVVGRMGSAGARNLVILSTESVRNLDDLRSMKLRHFTTIGVRAFRRLGIPTQSLPASDLYLALRLGVVDASVYGPQYIEAQALHEVACCYTPVGVFSMAEPVVIGAEAEFWNSLPHTLREKIRAVTRRYYLRGLEQWRAGTADEAAEQRLQRKGMRELPPLPMHDRERIQQALLAEWRIACERAGPRAMAIYEAVYSVIHEP